MADLQVGSVLVTGSNRGIGLELVKKFLESPVPPDWVFATCRDPEGPKAQELKALASEHSNLMVLQLDVTNHSSILEAAKKVESKLDGSGLNLVINNAAMMHRTMLHDSTREDLMESYDNNVIGPLLVALNMLTRCQAETYRKDGILSVAIHPGWVQTDMGSMAAPLTKDASVRGMLRVLASLSEKNTGTMMDWEGNTLPW
ncbi:uncharacterized protein [Ambystoma mexicanum]|uniref:uncharacterized protein isoform X3 n=1 Tax=Ambystoma mexicanum TaxID=8296 RepID=UPI0037E9A30F